MQFFPHAEAEFVGWVHDCDMHHLPIFSHKCSHSDLEDNERLDIVQVMTCSLPIFRVTSVRIQSGSFSTTSYIITSVVSIVTCICVFQCWMLSFENSDFTLVCQSEIRYWDSTVPCISISASPVNSVFVLYIIFISKLAYGVRTRKISV